MSFFAQSSVLIRGGNFYSAARDVHIQNDRHLAIAGSESGPKHNRGAWAVSGPARSTRARVEAGRFLPYERAGSRQGPSRPSSRPHRSPGSEEPFALPSFGAAFGTNDYAAPRINPVHGFLPVDRVHADGGAYAPRENAYPSSPVPTTTIRNSTFISGNVNNALGTGESGIHILHRFSASEAFHDSGESHDQPRCHPETRIKMQEKLLKWCFLDCPLASDEREPSVLWLHGPAGAGKSAIMYTLSERLMAEGRLGGAFFFKRGHASRGNAGALFTTIALQLALNSAQLKLQISQIVDENPTIVGKSIRLQLEELILKPCIDCEDSSRTIIIDGLDECKGRDVQQEILRLILHPACQRTSLRFIIASRPEAHIRETLEESSHRGLYRKLDVESCFDDVRRYLVAEFARIHREHRTMATIRRPWPSQEIIERLVGKSSGYFIYASTVIKFVNDKDFRPTQRLEVLLEHRTRAHFDSPFGALDELYAQILSDVPTNPQLIPILRIVDTIAGNCTVSDADMLLQLEPGDTELYLRRLHSVIKIDFASPRFLHASFSDFLRDPSRAGDFYIGDSPGLQVAKTLFKEVGYNYEDPTKNRNGPLGFWLGAALDQGLHHVEPSQDLLPLVSAVNYDFTLSPQSWGFPWISSGFWMNFEGRNWLKGFQQSEDLIRRWEDHAFSVQLGRGCDMLSPPDFELTWRHLSGRVMEHVARFPVLLDICCGLQWASSSDENLLLIRHLLDISWDEFHAAVCPMRHILDGSGLSIQMKAFQDAIIQTSIVGRPHWRANICGRLVWGCIRVRKMIDTGRLPDVLWVYLFPWGRFIRGCPACPELLSAVQKFVPPEGHCNIDGAEQCYNVMMWLQTFAAPPRDEIARWRNLLKKERKEGFQLSGGSPESREENLEERWRQWEEDYPECTEQLGSAMPWA